MAVGISVVLMWNVCFGLNASIGTSSITWDEDAARLVPSDLHVLANNRATTEAHIPAAPRGAPEALFFGAVPLVRSKDAGNVDKRIAALASYVKYRALPMHIELIEDYRTNVYGDNVSMCFSQAINGVRIFNTAACGVINGADLIFEHHTLVRPPGVDTKAKISSNEALRVVAAAASTSVIHKEPWIDLNIAFVDDKPTLCWRVVACDNAITYFVDAHNGELLARTQQSYRPTNKLSHSHCGCPT